MASQVPSTLDSERRRKKKKKTGVTTKGAIANPESGVKTVGATPNLTPTEQATSGATGKTPPEKEETEGATSGATANTPPEKKKAGLKLKKRARAPEAPQSQEREEGPSTEPTNAPLKSRNSTPGGAKQGSQLQTEQPPWRFKPGGIDKYLRRLAQKESKKAKVEKGIQAVKAPEEPGAKTSEQHKVEGGWEGTERGLEQVGVKGSGILIFTQELGEKAEILRREEEGPVRAENEEGKG
jgi:hypothetical protein